MVHRSSRSAGKRISPSNISVRKSGDLHQRYDGVKGHYSQLPEVFVAVRGSYFNCIAGKYCMICFINVKLFIMSLINTINRPEVFLD